MMNLNSTQKLKKQIYFLNGKGRQQFKKQKDQTFPWKL